MKCLSTFICCGWAYGCDLGLLYPWRCGQQNISTFLCLDGCLGGTLNCYTCGGMAEELNFWKIRVRLSQMTLQCHGWCCKHLLTASHIQFRCIWSVWATSYAVDGRMGETLNCYPWSCGPRIIFLQNRANIEPNDVVVSWLMLQTHADWLHPTSISDVFEVFEHLHMLWMGVWVQP